MKRLAPSFAMMKERERRRKANAIRGLFTLAIWTVCVVVATVSICKWVMR